MPSSRSALENSSDGQAVDLVAAVGDEVEDEAELAQLLRELAHLVVGHPGGVPVERRRQVVGEHLVRVHRVDRLGELASFLEVGRLGLHPEQVGERCRRQATWRSRTGRRRGSGSSPRASWRASRFPDRVDAKLARLLAQRVPRRRLGELVPLLHRQLDVHALVLAEHDQIGHRLAERLQAGLALPGLDELVGDLRRGSCRPRSPGRRGGPWRHPRSTSVSPTWVSHASVSAYSSSEIA